MDKKAAVIAKNLKQFSKAIGDLPKQTNRKLNQSSAEIVNDIISGKGTGSFMVDLLNLGIKNKPQVKKMQRGAMNLDMKAGAKVHDFLSKGLENKEKLNRFDKTRKGLANHFLKDYKINMAPGAKGTADLAANVKITSLLHPLDKVKDKALPFAGGMAIANKLMPNEEGAGGDEMSERDNLTHKIAASLGINFPSREKVAKVDDAQLLKQASVLLDGAADEIQTLRAQVEKLALENREYELKELRKSREQEGIKVATEMYEKGLIKKADIDKKSSEIALMEKDSLELFKEALDGVEAPVEEGVDKLTFVVEGNNIEKRGNLADSVIESAKNLNF